MIRQMSIAKRESRTLHPFGFRCLRCGHHWYPRGLAKPVICKKCKSRDWGR